MVRTGKIQRCELWTEKLSRVCGIERLLRRLTKKEGLGIYGVILLGIFLQFGVAQLIVYYQYDWTQWTWTLRDNAWVEQDPIVPLLVCIGFLFGTVGLRIAKDKYYNTIENLDFNEEFTPPEKLELSRIIPRKSKLFFGVLGIIIVGLYICSNCCYGTGYPVYYDDGDNLHICEYANWHECDKNETRGKNETYLFSWDNVPGNDSERLLSYLRKNLTISWAENAEILKSNDSKTICIFKGGNSSEIMIDEKNKRATLKLRDDRTLNLKVKKENCKLNIYNVPDDIFCLGSPYSKTALRYGIPSAVIIYLVWLIIYLTLIVDILSIIVGIVLVPKTIINKKPVVDVYDVDECGGLSPIGNLYLTLSTIYFGLLTMVMVGCICTDLPIAWEPTTKPGMVLFAVGWIFGFVLFLIPHTVHKYMENEKRSLMNDVLSQIRDVESLISAGDVSRQNKLYETIRFFQLHIKLGQIKRMRVNLCTIAIVKKLSGLSLIPIVIEVTTILVPYLPK